VTIIVAIWRRSRGHVKDGGTFFTDVAVPLKIATTSGCFKEAAKSPPQPPCAGGGDTAASNTNSAAPGWDILILRAFAIFAAFVVNGQ
jgi:hypothetical protein